MIKEKWMFILPFFWLFKDKETTEKGCCARLHWNPIFLLELANH